MVRAFSSEGNFKEALKYAEKTKELSKDKNILAYIDKLILEINAGRDISMI